MNQNLVVVFTQSKANDLVKRHYRYWEKGGCDILGVLSKDEDCYWPNENFIKSGIENGPLGNNYVVRFLETLHVLIGCFTQYRCFCFIEADSIFTAPVPDLFPHHLMTRLNGYKSEGFNASRFVHTPWYMDRSAALQILKYGTRLQNIGMTEKGFVDRWLGLILELYDIEWKDCSDETYSQNTIDTPKKIQEAREAIKNGAWYIHGIKDSRTLQAIIQ